MSINGVENSYYPYASSSAATNKASDENSDLFDQILENAQNSLSEDISQIVVKLQPSSLGDLSIKVSVEGGITVARFETDNETVKQVLNDNVEELQNMLKDKGFIVQKTIITLDSEGGETDEEIAQQVVKNIENSLSKSTPEMVIKLKPESLGELSVRIYKEDDLEFAEFLADNNVVKNSIHANFDEIKDALHDKGFNVQRYVISLKPEDDETTTNNKGDDSLISDANSNDMDKNLFLNLLVTQLSNQDPLNPIEDREFIAQMAQFSTLEEMQKMNDSIQLNSVILDQINESLNAQYKSVNESLYYINNNITDSIEKLSNSLQNLKNDQSESLDNDLKVINELININKAIDGYDMSGKGSV